MLLTGHTIIIALLNSMQLTQKNTARSAITIAMRKWSRFEPFMCVVETIARYSSHVMPKMQIHLRSHVIFF